VKPRVIDETVELTDVLPTILELLDLPAAEPSVGISLAPVLAGERPEKGRLAYAEKGLKGVTTIVADDYQLIHDATTQRTRLFDLRSMPASELRLADAPTSVTHALERALAQRRSQSAALRNAANPGAATPSGVGLDDAARRELELLGYLEADAPR
jgi:arylsulfatase A-like enzyme